MPTLCGGRISFDWDDVLAYKVPKQVHIRDRWLGSLSLSGMALLAAYFAVFPMYLWKQYLELTPVVGHIDYRVVEPAKHGYGNYDWTTLPYCKEYGSGAGKAIIQRRCYNSPVIDLLHGSTAHEIFLATRISPAHLNVSCLQTSAPREDASCVTHKAEKVFVTDIENFSVGLLSAVSYEGHWGKPSHMFGYDLPRYVEYPNGKETRVEGFFFLQGQAARVRDVFGIGLKLQRFLTR